MELRDNLCPPFKPQEAIKEIRRIRIIDGHYNLRFTVEDGECITVDGKPYRLHFEDETHFRVENAETGKSAGVFHICQFGEKVIDRGCVVYKMDKEA